MRCRATSRFPGGQHRRLRQSEDPLPFQASDHAAGADAGSVLKRIGGHPQWNDSRDYAQFAAMPIGPNVDPDTSRLVGLTSPTASTTWKRSPCLRCACAKARGWSGRWREVNARRIASVAPYANRPGHARSRGTGACRNGAAGKGLASTAARRRCLSPNEEPRTWRGSVRDCDGRGAADQSPCCFCRCSQRSCASMVRSAVRRASRRSRPISSPVSTQ